ncbi:MAG: energy-coupling factor transporter transmembrane protein EcfT [Treponema sp.]|nr:energy-coupling factor transporter transmembrane protein EcfT [Treponema sp.]
MKGFLDYLPGKTILHKMHPLIKIFVSILICAAAFSSSNYFFLLGIILFNIALGIIGNSRKEDDGLLKRTLGILKGLFKMSLFLFILQILVIRSGNVIIPIGKLITRIFGKFIQDESTFTKISAYGFTDRAIRNGLLLVLRLTGATLPLSILISVTNLNDLSNTMVKTLHIPYKYAFTFTSAIRFIPVFSSEMSGIIESQKARGVDFEIKNPFKKFGMILPLCLPLLISSVRKIESTATAAELRGFYLRNSKSCTKSYKLHFYDILFVIIGAGLLAGGIII